MKEAEVEKKYQKYIVTPKEGEKILDLTTRPLVSANAHELPVKRTIFIDKAMVPETSVYQAMHEVHGLETPPGDYQIRHCHDFVETYIFLGRGENFSGLRAELIIEDERYEIDSPVSVYIPKGVFHNYKLLKGSGILIVTALKSEYSYEKS
jgi:hypothetical protein